MKKIFKKIEEKFQKKIFLKVLEEIGIPSEEFLKIVGDREWFLSKLKSGYWAVVIWKYKGNKGNLKFLYGNKEDLFAIYLEVRACIREEGVWKCSYKHMDGVEKFYEKNIFIFIVE